MKQIELPGSGVMVVGWMSPPMPIQPADLIDSHQLTRNVDWDSRDLVDGLISRFPPLALAPKGELDPGTRAIHENMDNESVQIVQARLRSRVLVPAWVSALHFFIRSVIRDELSGLNRDWDETSDPMITGVTWRPWRLRSQKQLEYWLPNFSYDGVDFWWDRNIAGIQSDCFRDGEDWVAWFDACVAHIRAWGEVERRVHRTANNADRFEFDDE